MLLAYAACDNSFLPDPPLTPEREEAELFGSNIDNHTQDLLIAFNIQEFLLFELPLKGTLGASDAPRLPLLASCPLIDNDVDNDGDGIPDNVTYTFTGDDCTVVINPIGTFVQSGSIQIVDRGVEPGYNLTFRQFQVRHEQLGIRDYTTFTIDGTYDVTATTTKATLREALVVTTEENIGGTVTTGRSTYDWTAVFTANAGSEVDLSIPLPSGLLHVTGDTTWRAGRTTYNYRISTPQALVYESSCRQGPEFLSGRIQAAQSNVDGAFVFLRYGGCAVDPIIQRMRP